MARPVVVVLALTGVLSGCAAMLPPAHVLESRCHVWYTNDGQSGIIAEIMPDGRARVRRRNQITEAFLQPSGQIVLQWSRSIPVGQFDGARLVVSDRGEQFTPGLVSDLAPAGTGSIVFRSYQTGAPWGVLRRSVACTAAQSAVGAAAVAYYVNWEALMKVPHRREYDDPRRPDR